MKLILALACMLQINLDGLTSAVNEEIRISLINKILEKKEDSDFAYLYDSITPNTRIIKVYTAAVMSDRRDTIPLDYNFTKSVKSRGFSYFLLYHVNDQKGLKIDAVADSSDFLLYPEQITSSFLNDVSRHFDINKVLFLTVNGVPGISVYFDDEIWIVEGNELTDLNSYVKKNYISKEYLDAYFLLPEERN